MDNSFPIPASSRKARINLSQYIIRYPGNPLKRPEVVLHVIMASIPAEVEVSPDKMVASISLGITPCQKEKLLKPPIPVSVNTHLKYKKYPGCLKRNHAPPFDKVALKVS